MNLGFIGLGTMGEPMAGHLLRAGHGVRVWSRRAEAAAALVDAGAVRCATVAELAAGCEIVCTNVTGSADVAGLAAVIVHDGAGKVRHFDPTGAAVTRDNDGDEIGGLVGNGLGCVIYRGALRCTGDGFEGNPIDEQFQALRVAWS